MGKVPDEQYPRISDHAMLRYLERIVGIDVEGMREQLMTPMLAAACDVGAKALIQDGIEYRIEGGVVVSLWRRKSEPHRREKARLEPIDAEHDDWEQDALEVCAGE